MILIGAAAAAAAVALTKDVFHAGTHLDRQLLDRLDHHYTVPGPDR